MIKLILLVVVVLVLAFVSPFVTIWALNTLFPALAIPTTIWTYLAVAWIHTVIAGSIGYKKD